MECKICNNHAAKAFEAKVLNKYQAPIYKCNKCGFLFFGDTPWISEAYSSAINNQDTGIIIRNLKLSKISTVIFLFFFKNKGNLIDYGGGTGLLVRLLRDIGLNSFWQDKFCKNIFAQGFEYNQSNSKNTLLLSFEVFEHLENPYLEIKEMLKISKNILFTTELLPEDIPEYGTKEEKKKEDWWYYQFSHGQHISFYDKKTLEYIAKKNNLFFYSFRGIHLFSEKKINPLFFAFSILFSTPLFYIFKLFLKSKTWEDHIQQRRE